MIECPACDSSEFTLSRNEENGDAGLDVHCADCENATAIVVAKRLDARLQRESDHSLGEWSA